MKKFFKDFKAFISKGNIIDMAVGVIIGGAFSKIVTSLVNDIIMPLITLLTGKASLADLSIVLRTAEDGTQLTWNYGNFIQSIIDFLIIAICIFTAIRIMMKSQEGLKSFSGELKKYRVTKEEKRAYKDEAQLRGVKYRVVLEEKIAEKAKKAEEERLAKEKAEKEAEEKAKLEAEAKARENTELLIQIRDLLKKE